MRLPPLAPLLGCLLAACAAPTAVVPDQADRQLLALRGRIASEGPAAVYDSLTEQTWLATRDLARERIRQDAGVRLGLRHALRDELNRWKQQVGADPDLFYLEARLLQQPERRRARFETLARRYPLHAWIRCAAASLVLADGDYPLAARHLAAVPARGTILRFRTLTKAKLAYARGHEERAKECLRAWTKSVDDPGAVALLESYTTSSAPLPGALTAIADQELARLAALHAAREPVPQAEAWDALTDHLAGALIDDPGIGWDALVEGLSTRADSIGFAADFDPDACYKAALVGRMICPEPDRSRWAAEAARLGRFLLLGKRARGPIEMVDFHDCRIERLPVGPGGSKAWVVLAGSKRYDPDQDIPPGGALFAGFYVRQDRLRAVAQAQQASIDLLLARGPVPTIPAGLATGCGVLPPEDADLPLRIRARALEQGEDAIRAGLLATLIHEAGHLPDTLPIIEKGLEVGSALSVLGDALPLGLDPEAVFEYRAQLRALGSGLVTGWQLADTVQVSRGRDVPHRTAYRHILRGLLRVAAAEGLPGLRAWDRLPADAVQRLAHQLMREEGVEPLSDEAIAALSGLVADLPRE